MNAKLYANYGVNCCFRAVLKRICNFVTVSFFVNEPSAKFYNQNDEPLASELKKKMEWKRVVK